VSTYHYFILLDYDETIANTFRQNRNGIDVTQAYQIACDQIFGCRIFEQVGGLKNRTPGELVATILSAENEHVLTNAHNYLDKKNGENLGEHIQFVQDADLIELLVSAKLELLMAQIGTPCHDDSLWPNPCPGFVDLWKAMATFNERHSKVKLVPEIVSSGHDLFIKKCFKLWGLSEPTLMVTDDTMRSIACNHLLAEERRKPHIGPVRILCAQWLEQQGIVNSDDPISCIQGRGFYGGDCLRMDGQLAMNLKLPFFWFNPEGKNLESINKQNGRIVHVRNWQKVVNLLLVSEKAADMMMTGIPFSEMVDNLFPS